MLLDIEQTHEGLNISYLKADGNKGLYKLPMPQYYRWTVVKKEYGLPGYEDITSKPVNKVPAKKFGRFEILEQLHQLPEDIQKELFAYRKANLVACDIETEIDDRFPEPALAEQPINCISCVDSNLNVILYTTLQASGPVHIVEILDEQDNVVFMRNTQDYTRIAEFDATWAHTEHEGHHVRIRDTRVEQEIEDIVVRHCKHLIAPHEEFKFKIFMFDNEKDMLVSYLSNVVKHAAILTFWNGNGFDKPYIFNRCRILGIDPAIASLTHNYDEYKMYPKHTVFTDYMDMVKAYDYKFKTASSYSLNFISDKLLGVGKLPYRGTLKEQMANDVAGFLAYNIIDSILVQLIHRMENMTDVLYGFATVCKLELTKAPGQVAQTEALISLDTLDKLDLTGIAPPAHVEYKNKRVAAVNDNYPPPFAYEGGHVKTPHTHIADWCACIDFSGLYPATMRSCNLSIDNYLGPISQFTPEAQEHIHKSDKYFVTVNSNVYKNDHDYAFKRIEIYLRAKRDAHKKLQHQFLFVQQPIVEAMLYERGLWKEAVVYDKTLTEVYLDVPLDEGSMKVNLLELNKKNEQGEYIHNTDFMWHVFWTNLNAGLFHGNMQIAFKLVANSVYGATANAANTYRNVCVADDITAEGRTAITFSEMYINNWINYHWPKDKECHEWLMNRFPGQFTNMHPGMMPQLEIKDRIMYIDTDSLYVAYGDLMETSGFTGDKTDFFHCLYEEFLGKRVNAAIAEMVNGRGGQSMQKFDLEYIAKKAVFCAKKLYLFSMAEEDGRKYEHPEDHVKYKGMDVARAALPPLCREMTKTAIKKLLIGEITTQLDYVKYMTECWQQFTQASLDDISKRMSISTDKYYKYVVSTDGPDGPVFAKRSLPQYRGAGFYNWQIQQRGLGTVLEPIRDGHVLFYIDENDNPFSYRIMDCPEWAPKPNYAIQFIKNVISPIEKVAKYFGVVTKLDHLWGGHQYNVQDETDE